MSNHATIERLNPTGLHHNPAFTHVATVSGPVRTIYVGGQNALTPAGEIVGVGDLAAQTVQVLGNLETALAAAGARLEDVLKWTIHVVEGQPIEQGFAAFQQVWGQRGDPPLITVTIVKGLAHPDFLVEIEAIAAVADEQGPHGDKGDA